MSELRPIKPIATDDLSPHLPVSGEPIFERVDPRTLFVDPAYQRGLSDRSYRQIRRIIETFDWARFKPPVCALSEEDGMTRLRVIDGQHTAIAAASIPGLAAIPIMIVEAADTRAQAAAFIGQNADRLAITPMQLHAAALAAQDAEAVLMANVCAKAGVTILRNPPSGGAFKARETIAVTVISALIKREGPAHAEMVMRILAKADLVPIKADHIKALDHLLSEPHYGAVELEALPGSIRDHDTALREATTFAATHGITQWKALASVWFQKAKKRRRRVAPTSPQEI